MEILADDRLTDERVKHLEWLRDHVRSIRVIRWAENLRDALVNPPHPHIQ